MSDFDLPSELNSLEVNTKGLYKELRGFIDGSPLPDVVSFKEVTTRQGLYSAYGKIVNLSNKVSEYSSKIVALQMLSTSYKRIIRTGRYPTTISATYTHRVGDVVVLIDMVDRLLSGYKYAVDNQLRFYGSVQYVLGSPRLSSVG